MAVMASDANQGHAPHRWARVGETRTARAAGIDAWTVALRLGADGLVVAPWISENGDLTVGKRPGRLSRGSLTIGLVDFWEHVTLAANVVLDVTNAADVTAADIATILEQARVRGCRGRLWVIGPEAQVLADLAAESAGGDEPAKSLHLTDPRSTTRGAEAHAAWLREAGIAGVMVPEAHTSGGLVALMHRFGRIVVADRADFRRTARRSLEIGVDGVCGADPEALHDAFDEVIGEGSEA